MSNIEFLIKLNQLKYNAKKLIDNEEFSLINDYYQGVISTLRNIYKETDDNFIKQKLLQLEKLKIKENKSILSSFFLNLVFLKFNNQVLGNWNEKGKYKFYLYELLQIIDTIILYFKNK